MRVGGRGRRARRMRAAAALNGAAMVCALLVQSPAHAATGAITEVSADSCTGSSNPTFYSANHRIVQTAGGRLLTVFDAHHSGQQLAWRDPATDWETATRGDVANGFFPGTDVNTDRPASIALSYDSQGQQHAWVVWASYNFRHTSAVKMRRLSDLDSPLGPAVGPEVTVEPVGLGNTDADIGFEQPATGTARGFVAWLEKTGSGYNLVTTWFTDLDTDSPAFTARHVLFSTSSRHVDPTVVGGASARVVARSTKLKVFSHAPGAPLDQWSTSGAGFGAKSVISPSATELPSGELLVAMESDKKTHVVKVARFSASGDSVSTSLTTAPGYAQPTITVNGSAALVVMVRKSDTTIVSRQLVGSSWGSDRVEIGAEGGGDYAWPNALRTSNGTLNLVVDGQRCPTNNAANDVIAYQRPL